VTKMGNNTQIIISAGGPDLVPSRPISSGTTSSVSSRVLWTGKTTQAFGPAKPGTRSPFAIRGTRRISEISSSAAFARSRPTKTGTRPGEYNIHRATRVESGPRSQAGFADLSQSAISESAAPNAQRPAAGAP
jgi:hypothetical protein